MNKNILIKGLIAGLLVSALMGISIFLSIREQDFGSSMIVGYASMVISLVFVFIGVKKERDHHNGVISFGKALKTGLLISLIASTLYVLTWLIEYYLFIPDFMELYTSHELKEAAANGTSPAGLAAKAEEMNKYKELYKNPFWVVVLTYMEILPVGVLMSLVAALVFKRKATPTA